MRLFPLLQTVRARLTLLNVLVLAVVLLTLGGVLHVAVTHNLMASIDNDLARRAQHHKDFWAHIPRTSRWPPLSSPAPKRPPAHPPASPQRIRQTFAATGAGSHKETGAVSRWRPPVIERIFDVKARQNWPPWEKEAPWDLPTFAAATQGKETNTIVFDEGERVRVLTAPLRNQSGQVIGIAQVGASLADVDRSLSSLNMTLLTLTPVVLLVAGVGGLLLTGWMLRPLRQVNEEIALIRAEDLSRRLLVSGQDEFSDLAINVNAMLQRLEESFAQQRQFTADASHELRTPLTVIKAYSSRGLSEPDLADKERKAWEAIDRAANLMNSIVQDLLLLARSDAGQLTFSLKPMPLWDSAEAAIEALPEEGGAAIVNTIPRDLLVCGDGRLLTHVFTNLLKNARRHTPADGHIVLSAEEQNDTLVARVADTGTGIPPEHLPHVMERFYRVDQARSRAGGGTGLGLSICESIVNAHGGHLEITSSLGVGTTVHLSLPRVAATEGQSKWEEVVLFPRC